MILKAKSYSKWESKILRTFLGGIRYIRALKMWESGPLG